MPSTNHPNRTFLLGTPNNQTQCQMPCTFIQMHMLKLNLCKDTVKQSMAMNLQIMHFCCLLVSTIPIEFAHFGLELI